MKKFTAIMLSVLMLISGISTAYAAPILSAYADMSGSLSGTKILDTSGKETGFTGFHTFNRTGNTTTTILVAGSAAQKKLSTDKMLMVQLYNTGGSNENMEDCYYGSSVQTLMPGQQVYMRAQYYIPSKSYYGDSYDGYNDKFAVSMTGRFQSSTDTANDLPLFSMSAGGIMKFNGIEAKEKWSYDTWYTVESVVTLGTDASVSTYVNGNPLTFEGQAFTSSEDYSTGKECIKLNTKQRLYRFNNTKVTGTTINRHLFVDNLALEVYAKNADVPIGRIPEYNPLTFVSPLNGEELATNELKTVTLDTDTAECDYVELYVDDVLVGSDSSSPWSITVNKRYTQGTHTLKAIAVDGSDRYERTIDVVFPEYTPLSFDGMKNGDSIFDKKFSLVTVVATEECEFVSLYIDDEIVGTTSDDAPYTFSFDNNYTVGTHKLRAEAVINGFPYSHEIQITLNEYNPLSFSGISNGDRVLSSDFKSVTVLTGDEECTEVSLYVDDKLTDTLTRAPFIFNLTEEYAPGAHSLRAVAQSILGTFELTADITLVGTYDKSVMNQMFDNYDSFLAAQNGGWYTPSSRMHGAKAPNGWFIKPGSVKDKSGASYGQSFSLGCDPASSSAYTDANGNDYSYLTFGYNLSQVTGNKIEMEWYTLFNNDKSLEFKMGFGNDTGASVNNLLCQWDTTEKKLKWNVEGNPLTAVETNKWQKYTLTVDLVSESKMSLSIDGSPVFDSLTPNSPFTTFKKVIWRYVPDTTAGSFVALDEIKITHIIPRPSFGTAKFYVDVTSDTDNSKVSPLTNAIAIDVDGGLIEANLQQNVELLENGKAIRVVDSSGMELKPAIMLSGSKLWLVPHIPLLADCDYSVKLGSGAMFDNNVEIGYDQYFSFTTDKGEFEADLVSFKVNGSSSASVTNGAAIGADVKFTNTSGEAKSVKLLLALYSGGKLMSISVKSVTVSASPSSQTLSANDAIVKSASDFSASLIVLDSNNYPIAEYVMD